MTSSSSLPPMLCCQVCGSRRAHSLLQENDFSVRCCTVCRLGTTHPESYVSTSHYAAFPEWSDTVARKESLFREYQRTFLSHIRPYATGGRLLDVGCSLGLLVDEANASGYTAEGIDLDSHAVACAQAKGRPVSLASLEEWDRRDYDIICLSHTLEHIPDPEPFLRECVRHLSPGGILAVAVPCHTGLVPMLFPKWWYGWMPAQHYCHYSPAAMTRLFTKAGLQVVKILQDSMDHRLRSEHLHRWQDIVKGTAIYGTSRIGAAFGMGDQLIAIGRCLANKDQANAH